MASYKYHSIYGPMPPSFHGHQNLAGGAFGRGEMNKANIAVMNNKWQLVPRDSTNDTITTSPLDGLHRMGLVDLSLHDTAKKVLLLITDDERNSKMVDMFKDVGTPMKRKGGKKFLVVSDATVEKISKQQARDCSGYLEINAHGRKVKLELKLFLQQARGKKVEIWKSMQGKMKQVARYLEKDLKEDQDDETRRYAVFSYLLSESVGDVQMTLAISKVFYRQRWDIAEELLRTAVEKIATLEDKAKAEKDEEQRASVLITIIDEKIKERQEQVQSGFVELCRPLLSKSDIRGLHLLLQQGFPLTYAQLQKRQINPLNDRKSLKETSKFRVLFDFIILQRERSQKSLPHFGLTVAHAFDAEGGGGLAEDVVRFAKLEVSREALRTDKKRRVTAYEDKVKNVLPNQDDIWITWDNFQTFTKMKFLRSGSASYAAHATTRFIILPMKPNPFTPDSQQEQPKELIYLYEPVPAPDGMFAFERLIPLSWDSQNTIMEELFLGDKSNEEIAAHITKLKDEESRQRRDEIRLAASVDDDDDLEGESAQTNEEPTGSTVRQVPSSSNVPLKHGDRVNEYMELLQIAWTLGSMRRLLFRPKKKKPAEATTGGTAANSDTPRSAENITDSSNVGSHDGVPSTENPVADTSGESNSTNNPVVAETVIVANDSEDDSNRAGDTSAEDVAMVDDDPDETVDNEEHKKQMENFQKSIKKDKTLCEKARQFQERVVKDWCPPIDDVTKVFVMKASEFKESSAAGNGMVFLESALATGLIKRSEDENGKTSYKLDENIDNRRLVVCGDVLTVDMLINFFNRVDKEILNGPTDEATSKSLEKEIVGILQTLHEKLIMIPGDFHFSLHQLECLFRGFYGSWLQTFQFALEFTNIISDPKERYQRSKDFVSMIGWELERALWKRFITETFPSNEEIKLGAVEIARRFIAYKKQLQEQEADPVVKTSAAFLQLWYEFELTIQATRAGDSIAMECLYIAWLPVFTQFGKNHYKECSLRQMESLYKCAVDTLQFIRCNRFVRLNPGRAMIALDAFCEHLNRYMSEYKNVTTSEQLVDQSIHIPLSRACRRFVQMYMTGKGTDIDDYEDEGDLDAYGFLRSSIPGGRKEEKQTIFDLIARAKLVEATAENREWKQYVNRLWDVAGTVQKETEKRRKDKKGEPTPEEAPKAAANGPPDNAPTQSQEGNPPTESQESNLSAGSRLVDSQDSSLLSVCSALPSPKKPTVNSNDTSHPLFTAQSETARLKEIVDGIGSVSAIDDSQKEAESNPNEEDAVLPSSGTHVVFAGYRMKKEPLVCDLRRGSFRELGEKKLHDVVETRQLKREDEKRKISFARLCQKNLNEKSKNFALRIRKHEDVDPVVRRVRQRHWK